MVLHPVLRARGQCHELPHSAAPSELSGSWSSFWQLELVGDWCCTLSRLRALATLCRVGAVVSLLRLK
jgi:hypothetical protein